MLYNTRIHKAREGKVIDHQAKNYNHLMQMKIKNIERSRHLVTRIYEELDAQRTTLGDLGRIRDIKSLLSPGLKSKFFGQQMHRGLT